MALGARLSLTAYTTSRSRLISRPEIISSGMCILSFRPTFYNPRCFVFSVETIGLHVASTYPGAQFYSSCVQINVTGGGNASPATVSFPGAYHVRYDPKISTSRWD